VSLFIDVFLTFWQTVQQPPTRWIS